MKRLIAYLMIIFTLSVPMIMAQQNQEPQLKLRKGNSIKGVDYTYISPWMVKNMNQKVIKELNGIPLDKVEYIEILKSKHMGNHPNFRSMVNALSNEPGFKLIGYNQDDDHGVKICADFTNESANYVSNEPYTNRISRLLIIQWADYGIQHLVIYIVGDFSPEDVTSLFQYN